MKDFHEKEKEELIAEQQKISELMKSDKEKVSAASSLPIYFIPFFPLLLLPVRVFKGSQLPHSLL